MLPFPRRILWRCWQLPAADLSQRPHPSGWPDGTCWGRSEADIPPRKTLPTGTPHQLHPARVKRRTVALTSATTWDGGCRLNRWQPGHPHDPHAVVGALGANSGERTSATRTDPTHVCESSNHRQMCDAPPVTARPCGCGTCGTADPTGPGIPVFHPTAGWRWRFGRKPGE